MAYEIVQPPFTLDFPSMSKKELKAYFEWFLASIPERVGQLVGAIQETIGFEDWQGDFTPSSLDRLGEWFASQVEVRARTNDEIQTIESQTQFRIEIPRWELTNRTFSIALDVGMYVSQVFLQSLPALKWHQPLGGKTFVDYGQPTLVGREIKLGFNPVRMMVTQAYGLADKSRTPADLLEIYNIWIESLK